MHVILYYEIASANVNTLTCACQGADGKVIHDYVEVNICIIHIIKLGSRTLDHLTLYPSCALNSL